MSNDSSDQIIIHYVLQDTRDTIAPGGVTLAPLPPLSSDSILDNPAQAVAQIAAATEPGKNPVTGWLGALWDTSWGKWAVVGAGVLALSLTLALTLGHSKKSSSTTTTMTQAQASAAQEKLAEAIAGTTQPLKSAGYNAQTITTAQNQVALVGGTRIAFATIVSNPSTDKGPLDVIGQTSPSHYASLNTINTRAYVSSLSNAPTTGDLIKNSAAVHGLATTSQP